MIALTANEYHREGDASVRKPTHELNTATFFQLFTDNEADCSGRHDGLEEFAGRDVDLRVKPMSGQQTSHGIQASEVMVDNCNYGMLR